MSPLAQDLAQVVARARSSDRTVRAVMTYADGITVAVKPGSLAGRGTADFESAVQAVLSGVLDGYHTATARAAGVTGVDPEWADDPTGRAFAELSEAIAAIRAHGAGPAGHATVEWRNEHPLVRITARPPLPPVPDMENDINAALAAAFADHARQAQRLYANRFAHPTGSTSDHTTV